MISSYENGHRVRLKEKFTTEPLGLTTLSGYKGGIIFPSQDIPVGTVGEIDWFGTSSDTYQPSGTVPVLFPQPYGREDIPVDLLEDA